MDGVLRCSRYAFGPNRFHYCGPDANQEIYSYIQNGVTDPGLEKLLQSFQSLYPYLQLIARSNNIADIFDDRVVEAYWLGNQLLDNISQKQLFRHLQDKLQPRLKKKDFDLITAKVGQGAVPHHSFHILDVWRQTTSFDQGHDLSSLNDCRVSCGRVTEVDGPFITVQTDSLTIEQGNFILRSDTSKKLNRTFVDCIDIEQLQVDDLISMHWGEICEKITPTMADNLRKYTAAHLHLANQTL